MTGKARAGMTGDPDEVRNTEVRNMGEADSADATAAAGHGPRFIDAKRRGFLQGTAVAGAAALAGRAQAGEPSTNPQPEAPAVASKSQGYRVTEHVRKYYDRARF